MPSGPADLQTVIRLDSAFRPQRVIVHGSADQRAVADTLTWQTDTAFLRRNGRREPIPTTAGAAFIGTNLHTGMWLASTLRSHPGRAARNSGLSATHLGRHAAGISGCP